MPSAVKPAVVAAAAVAEVPELWPPVRSVVAVEACATAAVAAVGAAPQRLLEPPDGDFQRTEEVVDGPGLRPELEASSSSAEPTEQSSAA